MTTIPKDLLTGKYLHLRSNLRLKVCHEPGNTPSLVFLHGGLGNRFNWRCQYEYFADAGREVLVYDLPGHGQSSPYNRYSFGRHRRDLTRLLHHYSIREPILCCHSYGVPLGLEWAEHHNVRGLILIAGGTHDLDPWWEVPAMKLMTYLGRHLLRIPFVETSLQKVSTTHDGEKITRFLRECPIPKNIHAYEALKIFRGYNFFDRYRSSSVFNIPVLVITGGQDPSFGKQMGDELTRCFRRGQHLHLSRAGHLLIAECDTEVNGAVETDKGEIIAFANVVPEYRINEITIDLMRYKKDMETGTMDFLFLSMLQYFKDKGYDGFNFGLSALSGVGEEPRSNNLEKVLAYLYKHLNQFYNFQGLHAYKAKFHPRWEPRYLIYPGTTSLPDVVVALIRADSGDRLLDYIKPGS